MVDQITFRQELGGAFALSAKGGGQWMPDEAHLDKLGIRFEKAILDMSIKGDQGFTANALRKGADQIDFHRVSDEDEILETKTIEFEVI